jgi:hypothetical protein
MKFLFLSVFPFSSGLELFFSNEPLNWCLFDLKAAFHLRILIGCNRMPCYTAIGRAMSEHGGRPQLLGLSKYLPKQVEPALALGCAIALLHLMGMGSSTILCPKSKGRVIVESL